MESADSKVFFENHLLRVCTAIGGKEEGKYVPGDEAIGNYIVIRLFERPEAFLAIG